MAEEPKPAPVLRRCWEIADENLARYAATLKRGDGHEQVCRDMIDKWLDYRLEHEATDMAAPL